MTAETDLLPLPEELKGRGKSGAIKHYARACVAHAIAPLQAEIEALRAEVAELKRANDQLGEHGTKLYAKAERLAEALRHVKQKLDDVVMIRGCHGAFAGTYMIVTEALHPTAAQEDDDAN